MHDEKGKQRGLIGEALGLFNLQEYRLVFEPSTDSKAMVAWNKDTILISFRGTASLKAAKLDLEVGLVLLNIFLALPEQQGSCTVTANALCTERS